LRELVDVLILSREKRAILIRILRFVFENNPNEFDRF
jgi:hypothetical protein